MLSVHEIPGALDLVIGIAGIDCRVEVKDGTKKPSARKLTDSERETIESWRGRTPVVVTSVDDVDAHVASIRATEPVPAGPSMRSTSPPSRHLTPAGAAYTYEDD